VNFNAVEANNGNLVDMFGIFTEIGGVQYTANQKAKAICKITDDTGVSHKVHLHKGSGDLPGTSFLQQRHAFSLSTFQGTYQGNIYTGYSGFWKGQAQVQQPPAQNAPQAPQQPRQGVQAPKGDDMTRIRSMALSYAKDMVCEGKLDKDLLPAMANEFTAYIISGRWFDKTVKESGQPNPAESRKMADEFEAGMDEGQDDVSF